MTQMNCVVPWTHLIVLLWPNLLFLIISMQISFSQKTCAVPRGPPCINSYWTFAGLFPSATARGCSARRGAPTARGRLAALPTPIHRLRLPPHLLPQPQREAVLPVGVVFVALDRSGRARQEVVTATAAAVAKKKIFFIFLESWL